ncbi:MAG: type II CAAX endopeptidase family protein [Vicinamibacterales bacterium]
MLPHQFQPPATSHHPPADKPLVGRVVALLEVLLCSDFPSQLALGATFAAFGYGPLDPAGKLRIGYVVGLSLVDTLMLVGLVLLFLHAHGERPRDVLLGRRPAAEAILGVPLALAALAIGIGVLLTIRLVAPSLHTVERNPLEALLGSPRDTWLFVLVAIVAGGVREEIQRAFLLHRFETWLGGAHVGVVLTSLAFGAGHLVQGADAAIAIGLLGMFWGVVYLRRRSAVAPMVSHAGFDLLQIAQAVGGR